jgi:CBS-domain-containing membrane protein
VLRALLATRLEYVQATQIAAQIGQGLAFLLGLAGLFTNPFLVFIALFVWIGAAQEVSMTQMKTALAGVPLRGAMITDYRTLRTTDSLARAVELVLSGSQQDFPVVEEDRVVGILTRADLLAALGKHGETYPVASAMQRKFQTADASDMLEMVFRRLQDCSCHTIPVLRRGQLAGLVTMENLGEFIMVQSALRGRRPQAQPSFGYGRSI